MNNLNAFKTIKGGIENMDRRIGVIGLGAAGNKAAVELIKQGVISSSDVVLINSTTMDFPVGIGDVKTLVLSPNNTGCGKERAISKEYAITMLKAGTLDRYVDPYDSIVIVTSVEGGTGSGAAPTIGNYCSEVLGKTVRIFAFIGFGDDSRGLQNTVEFFQELNFDCVVNSIRNDLFNKSSKFIAEAEANAEFCKQFKIMSGQGLIASKQNMDDTDLLKVTDTSGYSIIDSIEFDENIASVDEFNALLKKMILTNKSLPSEFKQLRLGVILNIKPECESAVDGTFRMLVEQYGQPYEKFTHVQYDGGKQYIAFISSGMKLPVDEVKKIYERYKEASASVDKSSDDFFNEISDLKREDIDNKFDMVRNGKKPSGSKDAFFKQFDVAAKKGV